MLTEEQIALNVQTANNALDTQPAYLFSPKSFTHQETQEKLISYPDISLFLRSEGDQMKSLRHPPALPMTYTFGMENANKNPTTNGGVGVANGLLGSNDFNYNMILNNPSDNLGEDLKKLREMQFQFFLLQKKSLAQLKEFIALKAVEMRLNIKRVREILDMKLFDLAAASSTNPTAIISAATAAAISPPSTINGLDSISKLMQAMLDVYFESVETARFNQKFRRGGGSSNSSSNNQINGHTASGNWGASSGAQKKSSNQQISNSQSNQSSLRRLFFGNTRKYEANSKPFVPIRVQETHQDTYAFMKIPLGMSSQINASHLRFMSSQQQQTAATVSQFNNNTGRSIQGQQQQQNLTGAPVVATAAATTGNYHNAAAPITLGRRILNENALIMCNICCEEWFQSQFFRISKQCTHIFCLHCVQNYFIHKINSSETFCIKCPQHDCSTYFYDHEIFLALNQDPYYVRKFITIKRLKILNLNPLIRWCIKPQCNNYMKLTEKQSPAQQLQPISSDSNATLQQMGVIGVVAPIINTATFPEQSGAESKENSCVIEDFSITCEHCKTVFCSSCCQPAHPNARCEDNYKILSVQFGKNLNESGSSCVMHTCRSACEVMLKILIYFVLYVFYVLLCVPLSLVYPYLLLSQVKRYQELNKNLLVRILLFLCLLIFSIMVSPISLFVLLTLGFKLYYLPNANKFIRYVFNPKVKS